MSWTAADLQAIGSRIREIIAEVAELEVAEIQDDARFAEDLGLDSLTMLEIGVELDYAFKLGLSEDEMKLVGSVRDCVDLVRRRGRRARIVTAV